MQHRHQLALLLPLLVLAACGEDQSPTAPTPPAEPGGPAFGHTAGHKVVNSLADPGDGTCTATQCTLREAIKDPQSTEISFAPGLTGTITLARSGLGGGTLAIEKSLSITGPSTGIVIRRRSTDPAFRIVRIGSAVTVRLTNLTIRNGKMDRGGGGILSFGTLALTNCTVAGNSATLRGGGIDSHGTLTLLHSTVAGNSGGGIANPMTNPSHTLILTNSTVADNSGFGILNRGGTLALAHSTIARNSRGGIVNGHGTATLIDARIVGNSTNGGISTFEGTVMLTNSTVAGNSGAGGGGIRNDGGSLSLTNSTVAGNSATVGGGILNHGEIRNPGGVGLTNSTVSGNSARSGGGIYNSAGDSDAFVGLTNSTVTLNSATQEGGGIRTGGFDSGVRLTNSLVAQNSAPTGPDMFTSPESFVSGRFSLIGDGSGSGITNTEGNQVGNVSPNSSPIDPRLGPLADNGGPTRTHALLLGSPAIDAASTPDCPTTDQRGVLRPQGAACDIGSYERK
jgi:CSLREA domain-containing protein